MKQLFVPIIILLFACSSCGCRQPEWQINNLFEKVDSTPPVLLSAEMVDQQTARLTFNESINQTTGTFTCIGNTVTSIVVGDKTVTIRLAKPLMLAGSLSSEGRFEDIRGNSIHFTIELWAKNTTPAMLLLNEFTTKGSETNPDRVELLVASRGNLAGLTVYAGTPVDWSDRIVLPDQWVERGTYIVATFSKGERKPTEYASDKLAGLSSNNGCLSVAQNPTWQSPLLDAAVWGNLSTTTFEGFGSASLLSQVAYLEKCGQWDSKESRLVVDSTASTATRSFCRDGARDTNSNQDWFICVTKGATFGSANTSAYHSP